MSGLPYDATPPPESAPTAPPVATEPSDMEVDPLDRPLDDFVPSIPEHVQELMGRMSKNKVYLLEETPAILQMDAESRVKQDPRIAALAEQLDEHDPTEWLDAVSAAASSKIRHNALYIRSDLIQHLSTSKVFSWVTSLGTTVMGIEWLNDTTLHLLFPAPSAALIALSLLSKAGFDPSEGDDPLLERSAHPVPISLLPQAGLEPEDSKAGEELLGNGSGSGSGGDGGIRRKGRGASGGSGLFSGSNGTSGLLASDHLSGANFGVAEGIDPNARVTVRFGLEGDKDLRKQAKQSEWYARHGRRAGKEVASTTRASPYARREEASWGDGVAGEDGESGRMLSKRIGRGRGGEGRGRGGGGRSTAEDLDRELEGMRSGTGDMDSGGRRGGNGRRPQRGRDDLDKELDDMFASRTTSTTG